MKQNIEKIYSEHAPELFKVCLRYTSSHAEAEDLLHDSFIRIIERLGQYKGRGSFEGWLKRVVVSVALNKLRTNKHTPAHYKSFDDINESDIEDNNVPLPEAREKLLDAELTHEDVLSCLQNIPAKARVVFNLYVFEKKKHRQIAKELEISVNTSKTQLKRARVLLHKQLMSHADMKLKKYSLFAFFVNTDEFSHVDSIVKGTFDKATVIPPKADISSMIDKVNLGQASVGTTANIGSAITKVLTHVKSHVAAYTVTTAIVAGSAAFFISHQSEMKHETIELINPRVHQNIIPLNLDSFGEIPVNSYKYKKINPNTVDQTETTDTIRVYKEIRVIDTTGE